jgi:hypothetical protein
MGTSLHTLVQMVDNGLGQTFVPAMAIVGILDGTAIVARPLRSHYNYRRIAPRLANQPARGGVPIARGTLRDRPRGDSVLAA